MKIVVTHLTRMGKGYFCVAGIDVASRVQVRPVLRGQLPNSLREEFGGPFAIGNVVDLGETVPRPTAPETEDCLFDARQARSLGRLAATKFLGVMEATGAESVTDAFGPEMYQEGPAAFFEHREGKRSLAHLRTGVLREVYQKGDKVRAKLNDGVWTLNLSVTDARLFSLENDVRTSRLAPLEIVVLSGTAVFLSVGVGRAHRDMENRHLLQVNGIFPVDDPYWSQFT